MKYVLTLGYFFLVLSAFGQSLREAADQLRNGNYVEAEKLLKACESEEGSEVDWFLIAAAVYEKQGLFEQAVDVLKKGYEQTGNRREIAFNLANNLYALERREEAVEFYGEVLSVDPAYSPAYLNRGNAYLKLGRLSDAVKDYSRVLVLTPDHPQKANIERMISLLTEREIVNEQVTGGGGGKTGSGSTDSHIAEERERRLAEIRKEVEEELAFLDKSKNLQTDNTTLEDYPMNLDIVE